ncbi:acyltransferase [Paenibacillus cineris]|uniref:Membrane protein n=1 Tax=Paenibacillus cineris TaxID=237530 RepID=A0ABQ4L9P4_9BACL|nr:acyltransferase [Paenibacillus cineris]GIO53311.1 membrane protein [Paenibacillus cineris]
MSKKARIQEIELLRGLAFLAVAMQHAIAHYSIVGGVAMEDGVIMTLLLMAAKFAVPVFIFITGMVLFYNYDGPLRYGVFIRKRFSDVLVPYILWSAVYFGISQQWNFGSPEQWGKWAMMLFTGKNSYHLWYVVMIMQFYLLFPVFRMLIRRIMQAAPHRLWTALLVLSGLAYLVLLYFRPDISALLTKADIPFLTPFFTAYADRNFVYFMFYFILGAAAGMYPERWRWAVEKGGVIYTAVFWILFGYFTYKLVASFQTADGLNINFNAVSLLRPLIAVFLVSSVFVIYRYALQWTRQAGPRAQRAMSLLGKYSYGTYLAHALMLRYTYSFDAWWFAGWNVAVRMLMSFIICVLLSYLLIVVLSYLPFGKWTAGVSSLRKKTSPPKAA